MRRPGPRKQCVTRTSRDSGRILTEGVEPSVPATFLWINSAEHWVLRVSFPPGGDALYQLTENNELLISRGASNRRISRSEVERAMRGKVSTQPRSRNREVPAITLEYQRHRIEVTAFGAAFLRAAVAPDEAHSSGESVPPHPASR